MADAIFEEPRLASIYDALDGVRTDLDAYRAIVHEFGARSLLDVGCGTGNFACLMAADGVDTVAVDPAEASLAVARQKPAAHRVRWICGDASSLPPLQVDVATMTGNVAQVFVTDAEWRATLRGIHDALRTGGRLVFESRDPGRAAWLRWNREQTHRVSAVPGVGSVESWMEVVDASGDLVSFRWTFVFASDGATLTSTSTLRFRSRDELTASLEACGFELEEVRDAPDRPGLEWVCIARRVA